MSNPEQPPSFETIRTSNGAEYELNRDNTGVFQYLGHLAVYDHIYITPEQAPHPLYLWRYEPASGREVDYFHFIKPKAVENHCEILLNLQVVADVDVDTYIEHAKEAMGDTVPDWETDE